MSLYNSKRIFKRIAIILIIALSLCSQSAFANSAFKKASSVIAKALKNGIKPNPLALAGGVAVTAAALLDPLFDGTATNTNPKPPTGGRWITNYVRSTIANSVQGSCHLARKAYGSYSDPKIYNKDGTWYCEMDWQQSHNPKFPVTQTNDPINDNPHFDSVVNDLVTNASNGNPYAQDYLRQAYASEPPPPVDTPAQDIDDLIKALTDSNNANTNDDDPNPANGGTGGNDPANGGTGTQTDAGTTDKDVNVKDLEQAIKDLEKATRENTEAKTKVDVDLSLPKFCDWAKWLCDTIKDDPDEKIDIQDITANPADYDVSYVRMQAYCPEMTAFNVNVGLTKVNLKYDLTPLCQFAQKVRPAIIAMSYFLAFLFFADVVTMRNRS